MNETPAAEPAKNSEFDRLGHISRTHDGSEKLAGVSTGIARHFGIDPVIVRIAFVVLAFFALAGVAAYIMCWLLMPRDGQTRSPLGRFLGLTKAEPQLRRWGLALVAGLAVLTVVTGWGFRGGGEPLWSVLGLGVLLLPIAFLYWLFAVLSRTERLEQQTAQDRSVLSGDPDETEAQELMTMSTMTSPGAGAPAAADRSARKTRRPWSPALFLSTISVMFMTLGGIWLADLLGSQIELYWYPAAALGVVTVGLLVGARWGDGGALAIIGALLLPVLVATTVVGRLDLPSGSIGDVTVAPITAAAAIQPIDVRAGGVTVDLRKVTDAQNLEGETLRITTGLADTLVIVPRSMAVDVDAKVRAGNIRIFDRTTSDGRVSLQEVSGDPDALHIIIDQRVGQIQVRH